MKIKKTITLVLSICLIMNYTLNNENGSVKIRKVNVENEGLNSKYTVCFEESNLYTSSDEEVVVLKAKSPYKKNDMLFDKVNYVEENNISDFNDEHDQVYFYDTKDDLNEDYDEEYIDDHKELGKNVFEHDGESNLNVEYDCRFNMNNLTFKFEADLVSEDGKTIEKRIISTDAIVTKNGGLDACILINGEEYMMSDYEDYSPVDDCSIFDVIKVVKAYLAVAETAEQIKANSNYKYNKKLESDGKGVKKGYLIYSLMLYHNS